MSVVSGQARHRVQDLRVIVLSECLCGCVLSCECEIYLLWFYKWFEAITRV